MKFLFKNDISLFELIGIALISPLLQFSLWWLLLAFPYAAVQFYFENKLNLNQEDE